MMQRFQLLHGGDYNPEQWLDRPDILAQDIALMKKPCQHGNAGVFSWSALEPQEGVFALDWLADIIHSLYDNGISTILATPSAARPVDGATLPETQAFVLCEVAALQDTDPTTLLSVYTEDYFAGCPAVAIHSYGAGRAYYLASRFDAAFIAHFTAMQRRRPV